MRKAGLNTQSNVASQERHLADCTDQLAQMGQLTSIVTHEIRVSLNALFLFGDLLEADLSRPSPWDRQLEMVQTVADLKLELARLHSVAEDYLSLARLMHLHRQPEDVGNMLDALGREQQLQLAEHQITLRIEGSDNLGFVLIHANTFRRALLNLIRNAMEAMPHGGTLTLFGERTLSGVKIEIRDTGCGILEDQLPLLFKPFYTNKPNGTGLGLYVVRQIVTAHGGEILIHSIPGRGTTCRITLPSGDKRREL